MDWLEFLSNCLKEWEKSNRLDILTEVVWCFDGEKFDSVDEFQFAIKREHWNKPDKWKPDQIVIKARRVLVLFDAYSDGRPGVHQFFLHADDHKAFSSLELMYKMHNHLVVALKQDSHRHFEGMYTQMSWLRWGRPPEYYVRLGS